jgi:hypothetical protein
MNHFFVIDGASFLTEKIHPGTSKNQRMHDQPTFAHALKTQKSSKWMLRQHTLVARPRAVFYLLWGAKKSCG